MCNKDLFPKLAIRVQLSVEFLEGLGATGKVQDGDVCVFETTLVHGGCKKVSCPRHGVFGEGGDCKHGINFIAIVIDCWTTGGGESYYDERDDSGGMAGEKTELLGSREAIQGDDRPQGEKRTDQEDGEGDRLEDGLIVDLGADFFEEDVQ